MTVATDRLEIRLLAAAESRLWLERLPLLERKLACRYRAEPLTGAFREAVEAQTAASEAAPECPQWHNFRLPIRKYDRMVVGSAVFKERPDAAGRVEIGYGPGPEFEYRVYMTEAVEALCRWVLMQEGIRHVTAETAPDGLATQRLLRRCGFVREDDTCFWIR